MDRTLRRSAAHVLVDDVASLALADDARHHLRRVLRLRDGEPVTVTDGAGRWRAGVVADGGASIEAAGEVQYVERRTPALTVAAAAPKGDRLDWLVAKCTEVGIDRLIVLDAEHSVVRWSPERAGKQLERWGRIMAEASMQSRRVWLPEISGPVPAADVLATAAVAEPGGRRVAAGDVLIAIGPEGGWSPAELALAGDTVSLGPNVLRVETAAFAAAVLMMEAHP